MVTKICCISICEGFAKGHKCSELGVDGETLIISKKGMQYEMEPEDEPTCL
jgi:hypothetical protein